MRWFGLGVCVFSILGVIVGCSPTQPDTKEVVVSGKVTLDGTVLTMGSVYFEAEDGKASGQGEIGSDGVYRVPTAPMGKVKAAVRTSTHAQYAAQKTKGGKAITIGGREGTFIPVPKKYEDINSSGLSYTISKESPTVDITLNSK